ncbi:MAG TPA: hypothetical protein VFK23_01225 [Nitrospirota bacterium]|nr:hypothetical protein [Nitrospirota bacterium]
MIFSGFNSAVPIPPAPILIIFSVLFIAQFVVPAYFGIQYLGRLPVDENSHVRPAIRPGQAMRAPAGSREPGQSMPVKSYKEAPVQTLEVIRKGGSSEERRGGCLHDHLFCSAHIL